MDQKPSQPNILESRKLERQKAIKKLKYLIIVGVALLLLFLIITIAAFREGGFSNLTKGDKNIVVNTINNVGDSFTGDKDKDGEDPSTYDIPVKVKITPVTKTEETKANIQNEIVFDSNISSYSITVKKDTYIKFINNTGSNIKIDIKNSQVIGLTDGETQNKRFIYTGKFTFRNTLDSSAGQIRGTIEVVE